MYARCGIAVRVWPGAVEPLLADPDGADPKNPLVEDTVVQLIVLLGLPLPADLQTPTAWLFHGADARFASGAFTDYDPTRACTLSKYFGDLVDNLPRSVVSTQFSSGVSGALNAPKSVVSRNAGWEYKSLA